MPLFVRSNPFFNQNNNSFKKQFYIFVVFISRKRVQRLALTTLLPPIALVYCFYSALYHPLFCIVLLKNSISFNYLFELGTFFFMHTVEPR